jgi:Fe-S-cluster-containing hydrogenase component 2
MEPEFVKTHFRARSTVITNAATCAGCMRCELVCSLQHEGAIDLEKARLRVNRDPFEGLFTPQVCHQCSHPACLMSCKVGAISIRLSDGVVIVDENKCVGCGSCEKACPFAMIVVDSSREVAIKCDFCGGDPQCIRWCPVGALGIGKFGEEVSQ